jgi:hypothetical protein
MIVCPVCEHPQAQGAECEVCGKRFARGGAGVPPVPAIEGLEQTRHAGVAPRVEPLPDLEPTRQASGAYVPDRMPDLDTGRAVPLDVDAPPIPDIERTAAGSPDDGPTEVPALVTCRYCRTPAVAGERICARCGMRLPVVEGAPPKAVDEARLCSCGTPVSGAACPNCGARVR